MSDLQIIILTAFIAGSASYYISMIIYGRERRRDEKIIRKVFAYMYHIKNCLVNLSCLQANKEKILKHFQWINNEELIVIENALAARSSALALFSYYKMEQGFDFIRKNPFLNVALQKEDLAKVEISMKTIYGDEYKAYNMDLYEDKIASIFEALKEFDTSNK